MSTLYIRLPSKAATGPLRQDAALECEFALASDNGAVEREGHAALHQMGQVTAPAQRVVLLLAASDVTLLQVQTPPLSPARLKAALPSLVEEQLISDPADCVLVAGPATDGMRTVAVVNRDWIEQIVQRLVAHGARHIAAVPAQLCLPYQPEVVSAAVAESNASLDMELAIRLADQEGMGLSMLPERPESAAQEAVQTLSALVPHAAIALYVPQSRVPAYQAAIEAAAMEERIALFADNWPRWIAGAKTVPLNLASGLSAAGGSGLQLRAWRWPLTLAGLILLINIVGLNVEWLRLKHEADSLRAGMIQTYKSAYPNETAILDPIAQMRQKIAAAQNQAGQAAPDDFTALLAQFGDAWQNVMQGRATPGIAALEYNDRVLLVRFKSDGQPPTAPMKAALAAHSLTLTQKAADVWQIRSAK